MNDKELQEMMVGEAVTIIESVAWAEKEINRLLGSLEKEKKKDGKKVEEIKSQVYTLLAKLNKENENMSKYMEKYGKIIGQKKNNP